MNSDTETTKAAARTVAALTTLRDHIDAQIHAHRATVEANLRTVHEATGVEPKMPVEMDGLGKVAQIGLSFTKDRIEVSDSTAYTTYVEDRFPTEIDYSPKVRPSFQSAHTDGLVADHATGDAVDPATGEIVPGVRAVPGGQVKNLTLTGLHGKSGKADAILDALLAAPAELAAAVAGALPAVEAAEGGEGR